MLIGCYEFIVCDTTLLLFLIWLQCLLLNLVGNAKRESETGMLVDDDNNMMGTKHRRK